MKNGAKKRSNTGVELMMHYLSYDYIHNIVLAEWGVGGGVGRREGGGGGKADSRVADRLRHLFPYPL